MQGLTLYHAAWIFMSYAFLGWCSEVVFAAACHGKFVNRGFLNGPICPIYGFGVLTAVVCLEPIKDNLFILFIGSALLASVLEFITGFILEKFFEDKWWDYSKEPFNIKGYVCLKFSLLWGLGCVLILGTVHPLVMRLIGSIPFNLGRVLIVISVSLLTADTAISAAAAIKVKKRLKAMDEVGRRLRLLGDKLGEPLAEGTIGVRDKLYEHREEFEAVLSDRKKDLEELKAKYRELAERGSFAQKRLLNAFPRLQTGKYRDSVTRMREAWKERRDKYSGR